MTKQLIFLVVEPQTVTVPRLIGVVKRYSQERLSGVCSCRERLHLLKECVYTADSNSTH